MVLLGPARVLAVEQPTEVESQVAAIVWLALGGLFITGYTSLNEVANPDFALLGAAWLRDLRNLRRTGSSFCDVVLV